MEKELQDMADKLRSAAATMSKGNTYKQGYDVGYNVGFAHGLGHASEHYGNSKNVTQQTQPVIPLDDLRVILRDWFRLDFQKLNAVMDKIESVAELRASA